MAAAHSGQPPQLFLGAMTGTSMDGLDLAMIAVDSSASAAPSLLISDGQTIELPSDLRRELAALAIRGEDEIERLGRADRALGKFIGDTALSYLRQLGLHPEAVTAIGSHGQTIRHRPDIEQAFTLQIGDPNCIAEASGICTVADFRRRDIAAGGQGAPLVPLFHEHLFASLYAERESNPGANPAILNIGGICNLTLRSAAGVTSGFDTGPGNGLMDAWIELQRGEPFDANGDWAASAAPNPELLDALLGDPFFAQAPPKSTGREHFCMEWLTSHSAVARLDAAAVQATLLELTARSVTDALAAHAPDTGLLLVCGGGRHNAQLMSRLALLAGCPVEATDAHGVDGDSLEAAAFGWLAYRTLAALPGNAPAVTGALGPRVLGAIYPGVRALPYGR
ncbi:MAG: anhydro-N-acetylmuramic acid kinase [Pseudomonadales bacterium]